ncbi:sulfatase-like hydrolase/transferase [Psychrosphaera algicola]|uniref:Sulfatase-like hydrolase/transferase n=1 Tax=Psychrosphaera algicola TaxID=3023714 RepID=A0ABT5FDT4_9GAMM|nr:sulfatase-like hydrolase/transferase [Psychrosphaera sp. G1-22]MDC2888772.1 sulfatase-like hydrolase/transferase [Psychrosphaera sp. G1-22]
MRTLSIVSFFLSICCFNAYSAQTPNVVMIVVDDLGWADVGYNDHSGVFQTPNIDALSTKGLTFTDAYAGAANCAPSRAVLMSGQYSPRHGVYTVSPSTRGNEKHVS